MVMTREQEDALLERVSRFRKSRGGRRYNYREGFFHKLFSFIFK